jgi:Flp pilus assembly pilin Flp
MWTNFVKTLARFKRDEKGVTLVEYGVGLLVAVGVGTIILTGLAGEIGGAMNTAGDNMAGSAATVTVDMAN